MKISKEKASHKIDVIVALGMACLGAVQESGQGRPNITIIGPRGSDMHEEEEEREPSFKFARIEEAIQTGKMPEREGIYDDDDDDDDQGSDLGWLSGLIRGSRR